MRNEVKPTVTNKNKKYYRNSSVTRARSVKWGKSTCQSTQNPTDVPTRRIYYFFRRFRIKLKHHYPSVPSQMPCNPTTNIRSSSKDRREPSPLAPHTLPPSLRPIPDSPLLETLRFPRSRRLLSLLLRAKGLTALVSLPTRLGGVGGLGPTRYDPSAFLR